MAQTLERQTPITQPEPSAPAGGAMIPPMNWVLSVPRGVRAQLIITGKDVRAEDLKRLKTQIDFLVDSFAEGDGTPATTTSSIAFATP